MIADYAPGLGEWRVSQLLCGHLDCCYCSPRTDSCDYLLIEEERRGCPPTPDCPRYVPAGRLRGREGLAGQIQAMLDEGQNPRQIARRLRLSEAAIKRLRAREAGHLESIVWE